MNKQPYRKWTGKEKELMKEYFHQGLSTGRIALKLNIPVLKVKHMAYKIGLRRNKTA